MKSQQLTVAFPDQDGGGETTVDVELDTGTLEVHRMLEAPAEAKDASPYPTWRSAKPDLYILWVARGLEVEIDSDLDLNSRNRLYGLLLRHVDGEDAYYRIGLVEIPEYDSGWWKK